MRTSTALAVVLSICLAASGAALRAAEAKHPVTMTPDQMKWIPNPSAADVMTATVWGDPAKGPHGAFHKFPAGFATPLHTHSANLRIVVVSGTMAMVGADGKELQFPAGSFYTQPNTYPHITKCVGESGCLVYVETDGKWDLKPAKEK